MNTSTREGPRLLLCLRPFQTLPCVSLHLAVYMCPLSHPLENECVSLSSVSKLIEPRRGLLETPTYYLLVRSTVNNLGLGLASCRDLEDHHMGMSP